MSDLEHAFSPRLVNKVLTEIAKRCYPDGAIAKCKFCQKANEVSMERIIEYMKNGFPVHCGFPISLIEKRKGQ